MGQAPKSGDRSAGPQRHRRRLAFDPDNRRAAKRHAGPADGAGALWFGPPVRPVLDQRWRRVLSVPGFDQFRRRHRSDVADLLVDLGAVNGDVVRGGDAEANRGGPYLLNCQAAFAKMKNLRHLDSKEAQTT